MFTSPQRHRPHVWCRQHGSTTGGLARFAAGLARAALLAACALLIAAPVTVRAAVQLPEMGEPADRALSPEDEARIGRQFMRRARTELNLVGDAALNHYLRQLGERLLAVGAGSGGDYHFFIVRDPSVNAFATPGGYIGMHSGLILAAQNESQLAGVLAHEIAHVEQRHIARALAESSNSGLLTAAGILAAILLSQQDPQAGQAALATGIAAGQQAQINYTRSHEAEADRIGIGILGRAGFAPSGMAEFFAGMARRAGLNSDQSYPFLRSHPLSRERFDEAQARASALSEPGQARDSQDFQLMRARLRVLISDNLPALQRQLRRERDETDSPALRYAAALAAQRLHQPQRAAELASGLLDVQPQSLAVQLLAAEIDADAGRDTAALERLGNLIALYPHYYPAVARRARTLAAGSRDAEAQSGVQRYLREQQRPSPSAWQLLAELRIDAGDTAAGAEALAEYYLGIDEPGEALTQLRRALQASAEDSPQRARLEARIDDVAGTADESFGQRRGGG